MRGRTPKAVPRDHQTGDEHLHQLRVLRRCAHRACEDDASTSFHSTSASRQPSARRLRSSASCSSGQRIDVALEFFVDDDVDQGGERFWGTRLYVARQSCPDALSTSN